MPLEQEFYYPYWRPAENQYERRTISECDGTNSFDTWKAWTLWVEKTNNGGEKSKYPHHFTTKNL